MAVTPLGLAQWLTGPSAEPVIEQALALGSLASGASATLAASAALRRAHPDLAPEQCAAALTQASLRGLASERYGIEGTPFLTRDGLEQATRPVIARRRAAILAAGGCARVVDLTAGLGFDASAFVSAGLDVTVVERSPETAALLAANVPAARLILGDATDAGILADATESLGPADVVFIDPARRDPSGRRTSDGSRAQSERDPQRWSPPWSFVASLARLHRVCVKTTPGFPPERLPAGWQGEWTSVAGTATEACLWSWPVFDAPRRAVRFGKPLQSQETEFAEFEGTATVGAAHVAGVSAWLHEPDPSIVKAGLLDDLAAALRVGRLDPGSTWLSGDHPVASPFIRSYAVIQTLPSDPKALRRALRERGVGSLTIMGRSTGIEPEALRKRLDLDGPNPATIVLAVSQGRRVTLLVAPR
ncbi:MAG: SAM-dependent methyltransferase [Actinobacteria bacterium]|uniref:Unannotated protein n=1 Tax=freshwater metagenome TaxID=449393 RepID=A0A6J7JW71_9ZZZZ|nr:SAM-dependent methyltransferase [Actinomycetota bacterium]